MGRGDQVTVSDGGGGCESQPHGIGQVRCSWFQQPETQATEAQKAAVIANAGMAIKVIKPEQSAEDCVGEARESIESGKALAGWKKLVK